MGVLDKFLDIMKLNDDDDYDENDDLFDDDYDDYDEKPAKKSLLDRFKSKNNYDDEEDFDDYSSKSGKSSNALSNKVTPMRPAGRRNSGVNMEVCVIKPTSVADAREITETLITGRTVILNLEGLDLEVAQRIIDFTSGAAFAISGNLQKISNYIFLVTPTNVDISGDLQDLIGSSIESPTMKSHF